MLPYGPFFFLYLYLHTYLPLMVTSLHTPSTRTHIPSRHLSHPSPALRITSSYWPCHYETAVDDFYDIYKSPNIGEFVRGVSWPMCPCQLAAWPPSHDISKISRNKQK